MCQIQLVCNLDKKKLSDEDFHEFEKLMCFGSFYNDDAYGVFNDVYAFKASGMYSAINLDRTKIKQSHFVVGHNRKSSCFWQDAAPALEITSSGSKPIFPLDKKGAIGHSMSNALVDGFNSAFFPAMPRLHPIPDVHTTINSKGKTTRAIQTQPVYQHHPFVLGDFTLVHNGIITNYEGLQRKFNLRSKITTDSYVILQLISKFFLISKSPQRQDKIIDAIQKTVQLLSGSFSVVLHDKISNSIYYFKNAGTDFHIARYGNTLVGSTYEDNLKLTYPASKERYIYEVQSGSIYLFGHSKTEPLKRLAPCKINQANQKKQAKSQTQVQGSKQVKGKTKREKDTVLVISPKDKQPEGILPNGLQRFLTICLLSIPGMKWFLSIDDSTSHDAIQPTKVVRLSDGIEMKGGPVR